MQHYIELLLTTYLDTISTLNWSLRSAEQNISERNPKDIKDEE